MEQQLEPKSPKKTLWLAQDGEDDEEELGVGLLARHSSQPTKGFGITHSSSSAAASGGEFEHDPTSARTYGTTSEHANQEGEEEAATVDYGHRNEEIVVDADEEEKVVKGEGDGIGHRVYFGKLQGTESINGISEMQSEIPKILSLETNDQQVKNVVDQSIFGLSSAPLEHYEETNTSFKHLNNATKADVNVDLIGEIDEDLMELDVERVIEKQNTHDLYCPNCNSCITHTVILRRRKPKVSNKRHKAKRVKKLDPIPKFVGDDHSDDAPEIYSNVSPTGAPDEQNNGTEQEQEREAFSCTSCFSLFIPIGNGCFKIFQFFRHGRLTEHAPRPQGINQSENIQSPQEISRKEKAESPQGISLNETTETPQKVSLNEDAQSPPKISHNEDTQSPQGVSLNETIETPQEVSHNEDTQSPSKIGHNEETQSPQRKSNNENMRSPQHISQNGDNEIIEDIEAGLLEPTTSPRTEVAPPSQNRTQDEHRSADAGEAYEWEILKSIVYGGLTESVTSLGVVSSAAGAGAGTLNVLALGIANLIGGLLVIGHSLRELKNDQPRGASTEINIDEDRYQVVLGRRQNFVLHATVAILSFLIFGLVPPVVFGFSFRKSDDKDLKLVAVAGASLVCVILLALGKGHVRKPHRAYFRTVSYYVVLAITASGISYVVGELINKVLEKLGLFESSSAVSMPISETIPLELGLASY